MSILVAIDFSPVSRRQLEVLRILLRGSSSDVYLLHVAEPDPDFVGFDAGPTVVRDQIAAEFHREHRQIQELAEELRDTDHKITPLLIQGPVVETVLHEAKKLHAGLIVVGSHGHGATYDLVVGSISAGIIRRSPIPVMVVPAQRDQS